MTIGNVEDLWRPEADVDAARFLSTRAIDTAQPLRNTASRNAVSASPGGLAATSSRAARRNGAVEYVRLEPSSQAIETLYQRTIGDGRRVVALIAIEHGDGASAVARALAERASLAPKRTLLVDASARADLRGVVGRIGETFERLELCSDGDSFLFRSTDYLESLWSETHANREAIVIDCAPAIEGESDAIPGAIAARSADAVVLVVRGGSSTRDAIELAKGALDPAHIVGIVVNGRDQPTVGAEVAREAMRLSPIFPSLARAIAQRVVRWSVLDVPA